MRIAPRWSVASACSSRLPRPGARATVQPTVTRKNEAKKTTILRVHHSSLTNRTLTSTPGSTAPPAYGVRVRPLGGAAPTPPMRFGSTPSRSSTAFVATVDVLVPALDSLSVFNVPTPVSSADPYGG